MATVAGTPSQISLQQLHNGDRMSREEFHRLYEQTSDGFQAELIGGIVYVNSPLKRPHGTNRLPLGTLFFVYEGNTPGVESGDNMTILLGPAGEPQPDLFLRILPEFGGQTQTTNDDYVSGAPELVAEIAHSSRAIDLHTKLDDYRRYGVVEYLALCLRERQLRWFDLQRDQELRPDDDEVFRVRCFPGLWIDAVALWAKEPQRLLSVLNQGLATQEHSEFIRMLAGRQQQK